MKLMRLVPLLGALASLALSACASTAHDVAAKPVPMSVYKTLQCQQLTIEYRRVSEHADKLADDIDQGVMAERIKMGVGVVLFWPALLLMNGETESHHQLAGLKGERQTLANSIKARKCPSNQQQVQTETQTRSNTGAPHVNVGPGKLSHEARTA